MTPGNIALALQLIITLTEQLSKIGSLISQAQNEGRDLTLEELGTLAAQDDVAKKLLADAIDSLSEQSKKGD